MLVEGATQVVERDGSNGSDNSDGSSSGDRSGDVYSSDFGDVDRGHVDLDKDGKGKDHSTSVSDGGGHFSWDTDSRTGEVSGSHGSLHGDRDRDRLRCPPHSKMKDQTSLSEKFLEYLRETVSFTKNGLGEEKTRDIFLRVLRDFFGGKISLGDLEGIAFDLYSHNRFVDMETEWEHDLNRALSDAIDKVYYYESRSEEERDVSETEWSGIERIRDYYENNKHLIEEKIV
ncbi:MAG: hypothetical protein A2700_03045 [Candidatus Blackburnbacteria bacterium RIFCSPHIGHO2_01_FULL_44_64]|nr:MAG: hypothetical protein A2700_03045 [Candidatus Blackburnbacteria bacterium RIFCSPHIGHO2_01_FULL_44_64]OGY13728.1 MAG: hypothetical protein A3A62_02855 [Candidatus Blackburnbacteria bacterium RIFCSPLOWO2_01_FULL_44_43]